MPFHRLIAYFFPLLHNSSLNGCITICDQHSFIEGHLVHFQIPTLSLLLAQDLHNAFSVFPTPKVRQQELMLAFPNMEG